MLLEKNLAMIEKLQVELLKTDFIMHVFVLDYQLIVEKLKKRLSLRIFNRDRSSRTGKLQGLGSDLLNTHGYCLRRQEEAISQSQATISTKQQRIVDDQ